MTTRTPFRTTVRRVPVGLAVGLLAPASFLVTGCSGDDGGGGSQDPLEAAKKQLDETPGVSISLATKKLPDGVNGFLEATGVGTHDPAFEGDLEVRANNLPLELPVISVDGTVYAKLPFTDRYVEVDPSDYGSPDPAALMDPAGGLSSWLTAAEGVEDGKEIREGDLVVTPYSGTLPGTAVADVIPSADDSGEFEVTFRLDEDDRLHSAEIVGPFYGDSGNVEYTVTLGEYGTDKDITAP